MKPMTTTKPIAEENVCEHCIGPAPEGKRFCSKACRECEQVDGPPCSLECANEQIAESRDELARLRGAAESMRERAAKVAESFAPGGPAGNLPPEVYEQKQRTARTIAKTIRALPLTTNEETP